jgi:hypothetical protein
MLKAEAVDLHGVELCFEEYLRNFYLSPDVAHVFQYMVDIRKEDFLELTKSLVERCPMPAVLEAFLIYCSHVGFLFSYDLGSGIASAVERGWELVVEMPM